MDTGKRDDTIILKENTMALGIENTTIGYLAAKMEKVANDLKVCVDQTDDVAAAEALTKTLGQQVVNMAIMLGKAQAKQ
jgi:hypothetical protein